MSILAIVLLLFVQGCAEAGLGTFTPGALEPLEATMVVDPGGRAGSDCRLATPCPTIARAAELAQAGDVVVIRPGTYTGDIVVRGSGTALRPIVFTAAQPGTVVVNGHIKPSGWTNDESGGYEFNPWVTWRGLTIRNAGDGNGPTTGCSGGTQYAVRMSRGWRVEDTLIERGQSGVRIGGHDIVIERVTFQDLARYALIGTRSNRTVIRDSVIRRINTGGAVDPSCGAVTKILRSDGVVFEGNQSYENVGPGFWFDAFNKNYVIRNNVLRNNRGRDASWEGPGLWIELNDASNGKVYNNTFANNTGAGLGILESVGVEVYGNTFTGNSRGIELRNLDRGTAYVLRNIYVHDNTFNSWRGAAVGTVGTIAGWSASTYNIVFNRNTYMQAPGAVLFSWLGRNYTSLGEVRSALHFEASGQVIAP